MIPRRSPIPSPFVSKSFLDKSDMLPCHATIFLFIVFPLTIAGFRQFSMIVK